MTKKLPGLDPVSHNTETMLALGLHEKGSLSRHQQFLESLSELIGSPTFLMFTVFFVVSWIACNIVAHQLHHKSIEQSPFPLLQGIVTIGALLATIVVLIKQNRLSKMEDRRAHLELQVNLLTEQKVTKLINLIEELRRDLPMIKDRIDPQSEAFQVPTDPESMLKVLDDQQDLTP